VEPLLAEPAAVRRRVLRLAALRAGCPGTELFLVHVDALDALVVGWRGQREIQLPGRVSAGRSGVRIRFHVGPVAG
jgi:tRNA(Ile)-lysidine synthase